MTHTSCDKFSAALGNISHVLCINTFDHHVMPFGAHDYVSTVYTAMWHSSGRGFRQVVKLTEDNATSLRDQDLYPNTRNGFNGRRLRIATQYWPGYIDLLSVNNGTNSYSEFT